MADIDEDPDDMKRAAEFAKHLADTDKETLWWAHYRLLNAVHAARYAADADKNKDQKEILHIIGFTADHWQPQLPGMPSYAEVAKDCCEDDAYHELTYLGERLGVYITGDEFMTRPARNYPFEEEDCPGHVASDAAPKVCGRCGIHIDSFRPDDGCD